MPNWCQNCTTFSHDDPAEVQRLIKAFNESRLFTEFVPCPPALLEEIEPGDNYEERRNAKQEANLSEYGYDGWYDWNIAHWGTKWEVNAEDEITGDDPSSVTIGFDTAWSPPIAFYEAMTDMGWRIKGYYWEPGMAFCGLFDDGVDEEYAIEGNSDWVVDHIPSSIDECFNISGCMDEWEQIDEDDDFENLEIDLDGGLSAINENDAEDDDLEEEDKSGPDAGC